MGDSGHCIEAAWAQLEAARFLILSQWPDPADSARNIDWTRRLLHAMTPYLDGAVYVNNLGEGEQGLREAYGANGERLVAVKTAYDPANIFHTNQSIALTV